MLRWLWVSGLVIVLDQLTKLGASSELVYGVPVPVTAFFNLTLAHNTGAAFSFLYDAGGWQRWLFVVLALLVSGLMVYWMRQLPARERLQAVAFACIIGGALGNAMDRVFYGYVVDFIQVYYRQSYFPTFNIADIAINIGAFLLIVETIRAERRAKAGS